MKDAIMVCGRCGGKGYDEYYNKGLYFNQENRQHGYCRCEKGLEIFCCVEEKGYIKTDCQKMTDLKFSCFCCNGKGQITWIDKVFEKYEPKMELYNE